MAALLPARAPAPSSLLLARCRRPPSFSRTGEEAAHACVATHATAQELKILPSSLPGSHGASLPELRPIQSPFLRAVRALDSPLLASSFENESPIEPPQPAGQHRIEEFSSRSRIRCVDCSGRGDEGDDRMDHRAGSDTSGCVCAVSLEQNGEEILPGHDDLDVCSTLLLVVTSLPTATAYFHFILEAEFVGTPWVYCLSSGFIFFTLSFIRVKDIGSPHAQKFVRLQLVVAVE